MRNFWSKFSVILACRISWHHRCSRKSLWVLANPEMKCSIKFQMARSDEFLRWMWGETNWNFSLTSLINFLSTLGHSSVLNLCLSRGCGVYGTLSSIQFMFAFSIFLHEWCLNHNGRTPIYICYLFWMWSETVLFYRYKFSLSNPLSWGRQDWWFLTARIG